MSYTITMGWWVVPAIITIISLGTAAFVSRDMGNDQYGAGAVIALVFYLMAVAVSLIAWLVWAALA